MNTIPTVAKNNVSTIYLHCSASEEVLNLSFNALLDAAFNNDLAVTKLGFKIDALNLKNASIVIHGKQILTRLPLQIIINKDTIIADINIEGKLELVFITEFEISKHLQFVTKTVLEDYTWLDVPELSLGKFNINVEAIADLIIDKNKSSLESLIDNTISNQFKTEMLIDKLKALALNPILIEPSKTLFISVIISKLQLSEVGYINNNFNFGLGCLGTMKIQDTHKPNQFQEPKFEWFSTFNESEICCNFNCGLKNLEKMAAYYLKDKSFQISNKAVTIDNPRLSKMQNAVSLKLDINGDVTGMIVIVGYPILNSSLREFRFKIESIDFQTPNILYKGLAWIFKSKLKKTLNDALVVDFEKVALQIQGFINQSLKKDNSHNIFSLEVKINKTDILNFEFVNEALIGDLILKGSLFLQLNKQFSFEENNQLI